MHRLCPPPPQTPWLRSGSTGLYVRQTEISGQGRQFNPLICSACSRLREGWQACGCVGRTPGRGLRGPTLFSVCCPDVAEGRSSGSCPTRRTTLTPSLLPVVTSGKQFAF